MGFRVLFPELKVKLKSGASFEVKNKALFLHKIELRQAPGPKSNSKLGLVSKRTATFDEEKRFRVKVTQMDVFAAWFAFERDFKGQVMIGEIDSMKSCICSAWGKLWRVNQTL